MSERDDDFELETIQQCGHCGTRQAVRNENDPCDSCGKADWKQVEIIQG